MRRKLSFCITTFNRATLIGETLESIISQANEDCEIVVVDGASTDNTEAVVGRYMQVFPQLRYIRRAENGGMDADFDAAVGSACGEYCWLLSSKDLVKKGAVGTILEVLRERPSLVVVNMEIKDASLSNTLVSRSILVDTNIVYGPEDSDRIFIEAQNLVNHVSCSVIRRDIWLERERARYYGSQYVIMGVIFQRRLPGKAVLVAEPLVCHRYGGQSWLHRATVVVLTWPSVVKSLCVSQRAKSKFARDGRIERMADLLFLRACGLYSLKEYRSHIQQNRALRRELPLAGAIAVLPGRILNAMMVICARLSSAHYRSLSLHMLRASCFHIQNWRVRSHSSHRRRTAAL